MYFHFQYNFLAGDQLTAERARGAKIAMANVKGGIHTQLEMVSHFHTKMNYLEVSFLMQCFWIFDLLISLDLQCLTPSKSLYHEYFIYNKLANGNTYVLSNLFALCYVLCCALLRSVALLTEKSQERKMSAN